MGKEKDSYFDENAELETEILHDRRWPRIRALKTGEVISVGMASRIMYLIAHKHTVDCITCHFKEEFNREIEQDTVTAVLERDIDVTDELLPNGEIVVPTRRPAIDAPGYVKGHVLPAGIYWEIINSRSHSPEIIAVLVKERWGFTVSQTTITKALNDWLWQQTLSGAPAPLDARPEHDGRLLSELPLRRTAAMNNRTSFSNDPPPIYEPRRIIRGITLRHPREVNSIDGHQFPFFPPGQEPPAPRYSEGVRPPSYHRLDNVVPHTQNEPSLLPVPRISIANSGPNSTQASMTPRSVSNFVTSTTDTKIQDWSEPSFASFSRSNVLDYLGHGFRGVTVYPHGLHEPVTLDYGGYRMVKRYMILRAIVRRRPLRLADLFPEHVINAEGELSNRGQLLWLFLDPIFTELGMSTCVSSRKVLLDFSVQANLGGLAFLINHMRLRRGLPEVTEGGADALAQAVIDELHLSDNIFVMQALEAYQPDSTRTCSLLQNLVSDIQARREAQTKVQLHYASHPVSGMPGLIGPSMQSRSVVRVEDDTEPELSEPKLREYREGLLHSRMLAYSAIESTSVEGFQMRKSLVQDRIIRGMRAVRPGTGAYFQLQNALDHFRAMNLHSLRLRYSSDWWAAVLTNTALAIAGRSTTSHMWMLIPELPDPAMPTPTLAESAVAAGTSGHTVSTPESNEPNTITTIIPYQGELRLEIHEHNLHRMRTWNAEIRHWPTDLEQLLRLRGEFLHNRLQVLLRLHGRELVHGTRQEYESLARLIEQYEHEFRTLLSALTQEINRYESVVSDFEGVYARCYGSSVAPRLSFTATESAINDFRWELSRVRRWARRYRQAPLDGYELAEMAAVAEAAVTALHIERMRLEWSAAASVEPVLDEHEPAPDAALPTSEQMTDEQPEVDHEEDCRLWIPTRPTSTIKKLSSRTEATSDPAMVQKKIQDAVPLDGLHYILPITLGLPDQAGHLLHPAAPVWLDTFDTERSPSMQTVRAPTRQHRLGSTVPGTIGVPPVPRRPVDPVVMARIRNQLRNQDLRTTRPSIWGTRTDTAAGTTAVSRPPARRLPMLTMSANYFHRAFSREGGRPT